MMPRVAADYLDVKFQCETYDTMKNLKEYVCIEKGKITSPSELKKQMKNKRH
jgi:hypothetical protein